MYYNALILTGFGGSMYLYLQSLDQIHEKQMQNEKLPMSLILYNCTSFVFFGFMFLYSMSQLQV